MNLETRCHRDPRLPALMNISSRSVDRIFFSFFYQSTITLFPSNSSKFYRQTIIYWSRVGDVSEMDKLFQCLVLFSSFLLRLEDIIIVILWIVRRRFLRMEVFDRNCRMRRRVAWFEFDSLLKKRLGARSFLKSINGADGKWIRSPRLVKADDVKSLGGRESPSSTLSGNSNRASGEVDRRAS